MIQRNIPNLKKLKLSPWRAIALGTWRTPSEATVYGMLEVSVEKALQKLESNTKKTGTRTTLTHLVAKAIAKTLEKHPDINALIRWGQIYQRSQIDVFCHVAMDQNGTDLSGLVVRDANLKSVEQIARELNGGVGELRKHGDVKFQKVKKKLNFTPTFLLHQMLNLVGFVLYNLNLWSPLLGTDRDPFGSVMLTNVGSLGIDFALPPLVGYSRTPLIIAMGGVCDGLKMNADGAIHRTKTIKFGVTFDHRLIDGVHAAKMSKTFRELIENPELLDR